MTTIEDKIKLFSKIVYDKIKEEGNKKLDILKKEKNERIQKEEENININNKRILQETDKKAQLKANELIAKEKVKGHQEILKLRQELLDDLMKKLKEKLIDYINQNEYKELLLTVTRDTISRLEAGKYSMYITEKDKKAFENDINKVINNDKKIEIELKTTNEDIIGGMYVLSVDGKYKIDNTLSSSLSDTKKYVGARLMDKIS